LLRRACAVAARTIDRCVAAGEFLEFLELGPSFERT